MAAEFKHQEIIYQIATLKHASKMVEFHNSYYGASRKPTDWLWEYKTHNPGKAVKAFAKDFNKVIATQGMLPIYMEIGTKTILSGKSESTLVLPAYRGTQIMQDLYAYAVGHCIELGMQFIWGFTPAVKAFKKYGFDSYPDIQHMVKIGNIGTLVRLKIKHRTPLWRRIASIGKLILKHFIFDKKLAINQCLEKDKYELRRGITDEIHLRSLFDRLKLQNRNAIFIKYDHEYLKWRVRAHPFIKYDEYQVYNGPDLKAFAIVALIGGILSISDLTSEDENATSYLLFTILEDFRNKAAEYRILVNTRDILNTGVLKQLYKFGFLAKGTWNLVVRDLTKGKNEEILDIHNWHINGLWTEGYSM